MDNSKPSFCCAKKGHTPEIVTSKDKIVETVVNKVTLTMYAGHPQQSQLRKANPPLPQAGTHQQIHQNHFVESEELGCLQLKMLFIQVRILIELRINGTPITMTLDTRASITIISEKTYKTQLPRLYLHKSDILVRTYTGETLTICGKTQVQKFTIPPTYH